MNHRFVAALVLQLLGIAGIASGAGLVYPPAGIIIGSLGLILIGFCIDPPARSVKREEPHELPF